MKQDYLWNVKLKRTGYNNRKGKIEHRKLWAESKADINTYRLGGFQRDTIEILNATRGRKRKPVEVEIDVERNEMSFTVDIKAHLDSTLEQDDALSTAVEAIVSEGEMDREEALESLGYVEVCHDNSYNWCSDFSDDIAFKVYMPKGENSTDWHYSENARVIVSIHRGLDARAGYCEVDGVFKSSASYDGLTHFLEGHVRLYLHDSDGNDTGEDYDGDDAVYHMLERDGYKVVRLDGNTPIVSKDGKEYSVCYFHPAKGF